MTESIFTKIIHREIPATIRYESDTFIAFDDIHPKAPVHVLIVPKHPYVTLERVPLTDTVFHAELLTTARTVAEIMGIVENYKLFMNVGTKVQEVQHIHLHLTGGWKQTDSIEQIEDEAAELING